MHGGVKQLLANRRASIFDVLMLEYALQPDNRDEPYAMRDQYLQQLKATRNTHHTPRQVGVGYLSVLQEVMLSHAALREDAAAMIAERKVSYAEEQCGHGPLGIVQVCRAFRRSSCISPRIPYGHHCMHPCRRPPARRSWCSWQAHTQC